MKNRYKKVAHFSEAKFRQIVKYFSLDLTSSDTAALCSLSRNTSNKVFGQIRKRIHCLTHQEMDGSQSNGIFECDESYFGAKRIRGKRGRGAAGKTPVLAF